MCCFIGAIVCIVIRLDKKRCVVKIVWFEVNDTGMEISFINASMRDIVYEVYMGMEINKGVGTRGIVIKSYSRGSLFSSAHTFLSAIIRYVSRY